MTMPLRNQVQLITYPDSLGGDLRALYAALTGPLDGLFGGVHFLPFYPSSGDRGFAPITYREVEPHFGTWDDVRRIGADFDVIADYMVTPFLTLYTLFTCLSRKLRHYLHTCPRRQFTMLDCHDGIPVQPDLNGILTPQEAVPIVEQLIARGANLSRLMAAHVTQP